MYKFWSFPWKKNTPIQKERSGPQKRVVRKQPGWDRAASRIQIKLLFDLTDLTFLPTQTRIAEHDQL